MKCNLNLLPFVIDDEVEISDEYFKNSSIKGIKKLHVKGKINYDLSDQVLIDFKIRGVLLLEDSNTLDLIEYPISIDIDENLEDLVSESPYFYEKSKNTLDIIEFLWENIVLEVPISVTKSDNITKKGNGWELK